jgi:hypothetical protein
VSIDFEVKQDYSMKKRDVAWYLFVCRGEVVTVLYNCVEHKGKPIQISWNNGVNGEEHGN